MILGAIVYLTGLFILYRRSGQMLQFVWGASGFAFISILIVVELNIHIALAALEARQIQGLLGLVGHSIDVVNYNTLLVPDSAGWVSMTVGAESSTVIELSVFLGAVLFYPRLGKRERIIYAIIGIAGTYLLNLARLVLIIAFVTLWGREAFPIAHSVVGRLFYFAGIVFLYWSLLTKPTLKLIRDRINANA